jgi:hypothetical protein
MCISNLRDLTNCTRHNNFYVANKIQLLKLQQQTIKRVKLSLNHHNGRTSTQI